MKNRGVTNLNDPLQTPVQRIDLSEHLFERLADLSYQGGTTKFELRRVAGRVVGVGGVGGC